MAAFHGRELEDEFLDIARELGGDVSSRAAGDDYLAHTHALYHGGPLSWAMSPKIFDEAQLALLVDAAETMGRIMDKVTARYLADADFRAHFRLSPELEALTLVPTGYEQLIPLARVDIFLNEETGDYQFCELNTDGSAGMTATEEVTRAIQRTETYRRFAERHPHITTFDVVDGAIGALLDTYAEWRRGSLAVAGMPETPTVALVDYTESASLDEVADFVERLAARGVTARFADVRELHVSLEGGRERLCDATGPVDCVYRRAVTSELAEKPCPGADALADAGARGLAAVIGGFRTWPTATKTIFAVLHSDAVADVLTADELAFVQEHVPETHLLDAGSDLAPYAEKDRWIAKPAGSYNSQGVVCGMDCASDEVWQEALAATAASGGVVQAYAPQYCTPTIVGGTLPEGADPLEARPASNMEGLYLFRGRFGGVFTRCGYEHVIGEWTHRLNMGCLVVRE